MTTYDDAALEHTARALDHLFDAIDPSTPSTPDPLYGNVTDFGPLDRATVDRLVEIGANLARAVDDPASFDVPRLAARLDGYAYALAEITGIGRFHVTSPITGWTGDVPWTSVFRMRNAIEEQGS
jgi:hypothetical protein